ncbi:MAG: hypothetical protein CEO12_381 [Parcubacteria group bacterium Gr01-1014_46]|nr:MAG: hypothetical protein CEO12_381 [Parcubacteria group bacterium Gr01-1014_46]
MVNDKRYKKIKNTIIAGASSGIVAGMFLVGGINAVYAETVNTTIPVYTQRKAMDFKDSSVKLKKPFFKKHAMKGWRKNTI